MYNNLNTNIALVIFPQMKLLEKNYSQRKYIHFWVFSPNYIRKKGIVPFHVGVHFFISY